MINAKELRDKPVQTSVPESLHNKILVEAKKNHEDSVSRFIRQLIVDYFLQHPEKGLGAEE